MFIVEVTFTLRRKVVHSPTLSSYMGTYGCPTSPTLFLSLASKQGSMRPSTFIEKQRSKCITDLEHVCGKLPLLFYFVVIFFFATFVKFYKRVRPRSVTANGRWMLVSGQWLLLCLWKYKTIETVHQGNNQIWLTIAQIRTYKSFY